MIDEDDDISQKTVDLFNERGHASEWPHNNNSHPGSKAWAEASAFNDWAEAAGRKWGWEVKDFSGNGETAPDGFALVNGAQWSVELTELVDGRLIADIKYERRTRNDSDFYVSSHSPRFFEKAQWDLNRFEASVTALLDKRTRCTKIVG